MNHPRTGYLHLSDAPVYEGQGEQLIALGLILVIVGLIAKVAVLYSIGIILLVVGLILAVLGTMGRAVGGRRHYY